MMGSLDEIVVVSCQSNSVNSSVLSKDVRPFARQLYQRACTRVSIDTEALSLCPGFKP